MNLALAALALVSLSTVPNPNSAQADVPDLAQLVSNEGGLARVLRRFEADLGSLSRFYTVASSPNRRARLQRHYASWRSAIDTIDFGKLDLDGRIDWLLLRNHLDKEIRDLEVRAKQFAEAEPLLPFAKDVTALEESRRKMEPLDPQKTAGTLNDLKKSLTTYQSGLEKRHSEKPFKKSVANRAAALTLQLKESLGNWNKFYNGYLPQFDWWCDEPYKALDKALQEYANFLKEKIVGVKPDDKRAIVGDPIGREALLSELQAELISFTPEELVRIAEKEFAWCEAEMKRASRELGYGDDWKKALEHVKGLHVEPGKQPELVRELALEAIAFLEEKSLVTIPPLAKETWRMEMMTPERQLQSPFFLGGEQITVSFPTDTMAHEAKMMSLRGNNIHFSRATVHHELIPGHHLQQFMISRHMAHRRTFGTPFWTEGWALYWEMLLWDLGFPKTPENRVGMLFWRMHRCARIIFSLSFHLETMTPEQCVKLLVERVGHEPDNAEAEVRRSFEGTYAPLYQCAYMLGGLQFRALHKELVGSGKMSNREFHDAILTSGTMPVEMVRARLLKQPLTKSFQPSWKFYELGEAPSRARKGAKK